MATVAAVGVLGDGGMDEPPQENTHTKVSGSSSSWAKMWHRLQGESAQGVPRVLNRFTLRFQRADLERFYMQHHWSNMSYWLWRSVLVGLLYTAISVVFGDEIMAKVFDVRMDHYTRTTLLKEKPPWQNQVGVNGTQDVNMWSDQRVIQLNGHMIEIPRAGFLAWHATWCFFFLAILIIDKFSSKLPCVQAWNTLRAWIAFGVMFLDLVITSFLNPSVSRFMTFVYAVLVRAQFVQTLCLVSISSMAMLSAGYVGSHDYLNSVSVAEFFILNFICLLASRQTEIHARLSLYRLWYIMATDREHRGAHGASGAFHGDVTEANLARNLLSLDELKLHPIPEDTTLGGEELDVEAGLQRSGSDHSFTHAAQAASPAGSRSPSVPGTPRSVRSVGSQEQGGKRPSGRGMANQSKRMLSRHRRSKNSKDSAARGASDGSSVCSDSDTDKNSEVGSYCSEMASTHPLPPWLALEGADNFKRSETGDMADANTWAQVSDVERFSIRGKTYLTDKVKVPAAMSAFTLHQKRLFQTNSPLYHVAGRLPSLQAFLLTHPRHFFFVYNRIVPYKNGTLMNCVTLLVRQLPKGEDPAFDRMFDAFVSGGDEFRNLRLKHLSSLREAPSVVTSTIWLTGGEKPVIIGKGYLDQRHFSGKNYVEVDVDVSPSRTVKMVAGKVIDHAVRVVMEEMLVLEGQTEDELPERPLGAWRWIKVNPEASIIELDETILIDPVKGSS